LFNALTIFYACALSVAWQLSVLDSVAQTKAPKTTTNDGVEKAIASAAKRGEHVGI